MIDVTTEAARIEAMPASKRTAHLQKVMGKKTDSPQELHRRALLITALSERRIWPREGSR